MGSPEDNKAVAELGLVASKRCKFHCVLGCGSLQSPGTLCHFASGTKGTVVFRVFFYRAMAADWPAY